MKKLWIDDIRTPPDDTWLWAKTSQQAISLWESNDDIDYIGFDHDLGEDDTVQPVLDLIEAEAFRGVRQPPRWHIHSANPVGRQKITFAMEAAHGFWFDHEEK